MIEIRNKKDPWIFENVNEDPMLENKSEYILGICGYCA